MAGNDVAAPEGAANLRDACLHVLDRGAEHLAIDVSESVPLPSDIIEVISSASDVVRARGGSRVWARRSGPRGPLMVEVGDEGVEHAARVLCTAREGDSR